MKKKLLVLVLVIVFLFPATLAMGQEDVSVLDLDGLYEPDMVDSQFAFELVQENAVASAPNTILSFNGDMVDIENVLEDGTGVYVAVLDTGLVPEWPFFFNFANIADDLGIGFTHDIYFNGTTVVQGPLHETDFITNLASGHGTHVTSTIVGFNLNNQVWVSGIAPGATIIPVKVLDAWEVPTPYGVLRFSGGTDEMVAAGIMYVAGLKAGELADSPVVINMSLGGPDPSPMIEEAIDYAIDKGVIIVVSAGNSGAAGMGWPGAYPQVISAGAAGWAQMFANGWTGDVPENLKSQDPLGNTFQIYLEDFSSRPNMDLGQKHQDLDVSAPGAWVVGPYKNAFASDLSYYYLSGTSMAAPHVSAISSLVLQKAPGLDQAAVETVLRLAAAGTPLPSSDATVYFPYVSPPYYSATWDGGDFGKGFLQADQAIFFTP